MPYYIGAQTPQVQSTNFASYLDAQNNANIQRAYAGKAISDALGNIGDNLQQQQDKSFLSKLNSYTSADALSQALQNGSLSQNGVSAEYLEKIPERQKSMLDMANTQADLDFKKTYAEQDKLGGELASELASTISPTEQQAIIKKYQGKGLGAKVFSDLHADPASLAIQQAESAAKIAASNASTRASEIGANKAYLQYQQELNTFNRNNQIRKTQDALNIRLNELGLNPEQGFELAKTGNYPDLQQLFTNLNALNGTTFLVTPQSDAGKAITQSIYNSNAPSTNNNGVTATYDSSGGPVDPKLFPRRSK